MHKSPLTTPELSYVLGCYTLFMVEIYSMPIVDIRRRISQYKAIPMVNKRDVEVFIVCLSCHFDVGLFHVIGQGGTLLAVLDDMFILTMTRACLGS
jgi:hypothetical protein